MQLPAFARSSTFRFGLLVFFLHLCAAGIILLAIRHLTHDQLTANSRALTTELREDLLASYRKGDTDELRATIAARLTLPHEPGAVILLSRPDGKALAGNVAAWPPNIPPETNWRTIDLYRKDRVSPERMGVMATRLPDGSRLLTGHVIEGDVRFGGVLEEAMLSALLLALPLSLLGAMIAARIVAQRVRAIAETAGAVGDGALAQRVPVGGGGDAFDELAHAINAMLERIEALVSELRIVTDGLAHDLRSPLTRLKATLDRAVVNAHDEHTRAGIGTAMDEADILLRMLSTALQVSRAEAGIGRDRFAPADLRATLCDIAEMYGPLAEECRASITVEAPQGLVLPVHRELLGQAIANLVDNALKYGGRHIGLSARQQLKGVEIIVSDNGPGIPRERRAEALRRFGRLDLSRGESGAGLGLSLAGAVARLHHGDLFLEDNAPGLRVRLTLGDPAA